MTLTTWIGVDIAKADFVAAQRTQKDFDVRTFPMTWQGFEAFCNWLPEAPAMGIVFEATGPYWLRLIEDLDLVIVHFTAAHGRERPAEPSSASAVAAILPH